MDNSHDRLLVDLDEAECLRLAATEPVGRLAWTGSDGPSIVPVNFRLEGRAVHVRTAAYSALARECDDSRVAFEVDAIGHSPVPVLMTPEPRTVLDTGQRRRELGVPAWSGPRSSEAGDSGL